MLLAGSRSTLGTKRFVRSLDLGLRRPGRHFRDVDRVPGIREGQRKPALPCVVVHLALSQRTPFLLGGFQGFVFLARHDGTPAASRGWAEVTTSREPAP